ncbi:MAG: selenide, water dikinase SelD, partial [Candidatus Delongbacteria bacterium]|nr:selenide, water dikinase SelD [Candidatus Delongbacteria bacterium]
MKFPSNDNVLIGFEGSDDAGVYKLSDDIAIVQTLDFITPVVDDPYMYGCIAAANSLSDVFAMGAKVRTALNIVAYDSCNVTKAMLSDILRGGIDKVREAGGVIIGGHTITDIEMKYGLSVTGIVHPDKAIRNNTVKQGDKLILTKPIGSGVITTAWKGDMAEKEHIDKAAIWMSQLNKTASEIAVSVGVNAMTDVTGFGLIGHLSEMIADNFGVKLDFSSISFMEGAKTYAGRMLFPGGSKRNEKYFTGKIRENKLEYTDLMLLFDAQTSGGL